MWGGGRGNSGHARKKTLFFQGGVPLYWFHSRALSNNNAFISLSHLSHWFLDIVHVRGLHTVATCAPRHPTAAGSVPEYFDVQPLILSIELGIAQWATLWIVIFPNSLHLIPSLIVQPVEVHIRADGGASLEPAQVCISCILKMRVSISIGKV